MDEETRDAFARIEQRQALLVKQMNDQHERLIDRITSLARDFQTTKGFLIEDAITLGRRISNIENRLDEMP